ncbi:MAG: hypothetical protein GDA51_03145 [Ekhidna sp.]|nr:hypothetical protein [Ekhidna sp.]
MTGSYGYMVSLVFYLLFNLQSSGWNLLSDVEVVRGYDEFMGEEIDQPIFSNNLMSHNGEEITLEGFIIPLKQDNEQSYFILSRFPYQSCFFCGAAGPETVVEVFPKKGIRYTDKRIRARGTLKLNEGNPLQLFYILKDCEVEVLD